MREIVVDVSQLEAPYPLIEAVSNLKNLSNGSYIKFIHRMKPCLLFDILNKGNFAYIEKVDEQYVLFIYLKDDLDVEDYLKKSL